MALKIKEISNVLGATARANKYRVLFTFPSGVSAVTSSQDVDVLAKSATAPQKEIGTIELWNQGRKLVIHGDTAFDNAYSLDFYADETHQLRADLLKWQTAADNFETNIHSGDPEAIFSEVKVQQLDSAGNPTVTYTLHQAFPTIVGEVTWGDDSSDTPVEFNVTFAYSHWTIGEEENNNFDSINPATKNPTAL